MLEMNGGLGYGKEQPVNAVQSEVWQLLRELRIMELLAEYHPRLAGTVPLGIQVEGSDLDIICEVQDARRFTAEARRHFGRLEGFRAVTRTVGGMVRTKINFQVGGWPIELFGQPLATEKQNAWLHMLVEGRILGLLGPGFRENIRSLKSGGMKTEPAFAKLLKLEGDPYEEMLSLGRLTLSELEAVCKRAYYTYDNNGIGEENMNYRPMIADDYEAAYRLWENTEGMNLSGADSREEILRYLERNPGMSQVCENGDGTLAGTAMCGHDGRRGYMYHVAVSGDGRGKGVGRELVSRCLDRLLQEGIVKCHLMVIEDNALGRSFWTRIGWQERDGIVLFSSDTF